jgi:hypothetical protein
MHFTCPSPGINNSAFKVAFEHTLLSIKPGKNHCLSPQDMPAGKHLIASQSCSINLFLRLISEQVVKDVHL